MSYVETVLAPGEAVRLKARLHWVLWVRAWAALIFLGIVIIGIVMFIRDVAFFHTTEIAITDRRLIQKRGLFERHAREMQLTSIEAVNVDQGFWGRLLGFGRVEVHGTGDDIWRTPRISDPVGFSRALQSASSEAIAARRGADAKSA